MNIVLYINMIGTTFIQTIRQLIIHDRIIHCSSEFIFAKNKRNFLAKNETIKCSVFF
jgi:hypothetical protein